LKKVDVLGSTPKDLADVSLAGSNEAIPLDAEVLAIGEIQRSGRGEDGSGEERVPVFVKDPDILDLSQTSWI